MGDKNNNGSLKQKDVEDSMTAAEFHEERVSATNVQLRRVYNKASVPSPRSSYTSVRISTLSSHSVRNQVLTYQNEASTCQPHSTIAIALLSAAATSKRVRGSPSRWSTRDPWTLSRKTTLLPSLVVSSREYRLLSS